MDILLVDLWQAGHHLEHLDRTQRLLNSYLSGDSVKIALPHSTPRTDEYFDHSDVEYTLDRNFKEMVEESRADAVVTALQRMFDVVEDCDPDIVHFVELDRIANEFYTVVREHAPETTIVASLNGAFFSRDPGPVVARNRLTSVPGVDRVVDALGHTNPLRTGQYALRRCLERSILDWLFVPTVEARNDVIRLSGGKSPPIRVVPDPTEVWTEEEYSKTTARSDLGLPDDEILLLFFGEMRREKGVDILLSAMERYPGDPPITLVVAGSRAEDTEIEFDAVRRNDDVRLITDIRFVPQNDMRSYFVASDGVVLPYRRSFGEARPSGVFQKAAAGSSPVIAPDFGVFGRRVMEYDLGKLFKPGSSASLRDAVGQFARSKGDVVSSVDSLKAYTQLQSYERYVKMLTHTYEILMKQPSQ